VNSSAFGTSELDIGSAFLEFEDGSTLRVTPDTVIGFPQLSLHDSGAKVSAVRALKQVEAGRKVEDVAREVGVSKHTLYAWKAKYGGMDVSQAQEAKQLRDENTKLRKLVADLSLDKEALQSVIRKNGWSS